MAEIDNLLDTAFTAYNQKNFDYAEELARNVLTLAPNNADGLYLLGLIALRANALEPAEKLLYQAVQISPENKNYKTSLGFVLEKLGRLDEALSFYEPFKEDAFVLSEIGFIYLQKGLDDFAKSAFDKALSLNKNVLNAYIGNALILRKNQDEEASYTILQSALSYGENAELLYQLAQSARKLQKYKKALEYINKAISLDELAAFFNEKGLIEEGLLLFQSAEISYETAVEKNPYLADAYFNLGNLFLKKESLRQAEDAYKRALGIDNNFLDAHHNLAVCLYKQNRTTEALEHFRSAVIINPNHISALYNLAVILEETDDLTESAGLYFNLLVKKADIKDIRFRISNVLTLLCQKDKKSKKTALDFAKGWIKNYPDDVVACYTYAALTGDKVDKKLLTSYSETLYDAFAETYDEKLKLLDTKTLTEIEKILPKKAKNILDLGCGTGSLALKLTNYQTLTGVDLSKEMLLKAQEKNLYTRLVHQEGIDFLKADNSFYDLIVSADVTGYLFDIKEFILSVYNCLEKEGSFIFTIEIGEKEESYLSSLGRYLHNPKTVELILKQMGFTVVENKEIALRKEGDSFAKGVLFLAKKD